jgi:hypothetical protein
MGFSPCEIKSMLDEYESENEVGMDTSIFSELIYEYTSGYPLLVSLICKILSVHVAGSHGFPDKKSAWTKEGLLAALRCLSSQDVSLFKSLKRQLEDSPELKGLIKALLFSGREISRSEAATASEQAVLHGFIKVDANNMLRVSNRVFETFLYDELTHDGTSFASLGGVEKKTFISGGRIDIKLIM